MRTCQQMKRITKKALNESLIFGMLIRTGCFGGRLVRGACGAGGRLGAHDCGLLAAELCADLCAAQFDEAVDHLREPYCLYDVGGYKSVV